VDEWRVEVVEGWRIEVTVKRMCETPKLKGSPVDQSEYSDRADT
jgi:hypothetical protein